MTRTTRNGAAVALATGLIMATNNVPEVSQCTEVAETPDKRATEQANAGASHSKDIQDAQECINIDSKVDAIVVNHEDNHRALVVTLVWEKLNECIKMLEAKKAQITLEAKLCSLKQKWAQEYLEVNASMGGVISLKDIFAIEHVQVCLDSPKYSGKSMRHYKAYKRIVEYTFEEHPFMYCMNKEKCMYVRQFFTEILAEHWKTMKTWIKESLTLKFDYEVFMEMLKKRLLPQKVCQIEVETKLKSLHQRDSQTLFEFISHLEALLRDIEPPLTDAQRHQNLLYSMHNYLRWVLIRHNKVETTQKDLEEATRSMELIKPALVSMQKATLVVAFSVSAATSTNQNACWASYLPKTKSILPKDVDAAPTTRTESSPKYIGATTCRDYTKTKCYNCNQLRHLSKNYPAPWQKQSNSKPSRKSPAR